MSTQRIVVSGGRPSPRELAALVAVVTAAAPAPPHGADAPQRSRWVRAARLESGGHPPIDSPMRLPR